MFRDRIQAANLLAEKLGDLKNKNALVLAIPRGAVPMAKVIADGLNADLDLMLVRKIGHPLSPEYAIGAIDEEGNLYLDLEEKVSDISTTYIQTEKENLLKALKKRRKLYTNRPRISPKGRTVIIVDDGIATGWTVKAAITATRRQKPAKIIVATAVSSPTSLLEIKALADEVVCLYVPAHFRAVSEFFDNFEQVSDEEVIRILAS